MGGKNSNKGTSNRKRKKKTWAHVLLNKKQVADPERLEHEATAYALKFNEEENGRTFLGLAAAVFARVLL